MIFAITPCRLYRWDVIEGALVHACCACVSVCTPCRRATSPQLWCPQVFRPSPEQGFPCLYTRFRRRCSDSFDMAGAKKSNAAANLHPYATRLPSVRKTGNTVLDEDTASKVQMLRELISGCLDKTELRERQRAGDAGGDAPLKSVRMLRDFDKDFS